MFAAHTRAIGHRVADVPSGGGMMEVDDDVNSCAQRYFEKNNSILYAKASTYWAPCSSTTKRYAHRFGLGHRQALDRLRV